VSVTFKLSIRQAYLLLSSRPDSASFQRDLERVNYTGRFNNIAGTSRHNRTSASYN